MRISSAFLLKQMFVNEVYNFFKRGETVSYVDTHFKNKNSGYLITSIFN